MASEHDYRLAAEKDVSGKANRKIWTYFISLGILLFLTLIGLDIMYRFQLDYEREIKIGDVTTPEALEEKRRTQSILSGKTGLIEGRRHIPIEEAMTVFLTWSRQAR